MANIPSVNRTNYSYSRRKRRGAPLLEQTEQASEQARSKRQRIERRHTPDRRRRNVPVLLNRRRQQDRRQAPTANRIGRDNADTQPRKGSKINTTA